MCVLSGPEFVYELHNDSYQQLVGHRDLAGKTLRAALPELEGQGFFELLQEVRRTGAPFIGRGMRVMLQRVPGAPLEERFVNFVYQPIFGSDGAVDGIFAEGADVTEQFRAERALIELNGTLEVRIDERTNELAVALEQLRAESAERDIGLPGLNGRQVADAARLRRPGLKVLLMTGYAENATLAKGVLEAGMEMMTKPFAIDDLIDRVTQMMK
jgi:CheY-like chemotaxis protein